MEGPKIRWECPQCGYLLNDSVSECDECGYRRAAADSASPRSPDETNSWVVNRLDQHTFRELEKADDLDDEGSRVVIASIVAGIGLAIFAILAIVLLEH
jgi:hypothetical protein